MNLESKIMPAMKQAMKDKNQGALRGLRAIKAAILLEKTSGNNEPLTDEKELKILQKLAKQRKDSIAIFKEQNREDLIAIEKEELTVIEQFLPEQMDEDELKKVLSGLVEKLGATSIKDMGKVMGAAQKELAGKADSKTIAGVIKSILG